MIADTGIDERLRRALHFNPKDLEENRNGRLSERQKRRLRWRFLSNFWMLIGAILFLIIVGAAAIFVSQFMVTLWFWLFAAMFIFLLRRQHHTTQSVIALGAIDQVRGEVTLSRQERSTLDPYVKSSVCRLTISSMGFDVNEATCRAFQNGATYTIYYLLGTGTILAAERQT